MKNRLKKQSENGRSSAESLQMCLLSTLTVFCFTLACCVGLVFHVHGGGGGDKEKQEEEEATRKHLLFVRVCGSALWLAYMCLAVMLVWRLHGLYADTIFSHGKRQLCLLLCLCVFVWTVSMAVFEVTLKTTAHKQGCWVFEYSTFAASLATLADVIMCGGFTYLFVKVERK